MTETLILDINNLKEKEEKKKDIEKGSCKSVKGREKKIIKFPSICEQI